jgi:hypothetical protein
VRKRKMMRHSKVPVSTADPNVDEIRVIRAKVSARFDNDVGRLCEHLRRIEDQYRNRVVQPGTLIRKKPRRDASGQNG